MAAALSRRAALRGAITLAFSLAGPAALAQPAALQPGRKRLPGDLERNRSLDAWLRIGADGRVTLLTGKVELGQGVLTAFAQICADELDVDMARIDIVSGDTARSPNEGPTAGSFSMPDGGTAVKYACAEIRQVLLDMARAEWRVMGEGLTVRDGTIHEPTSGRTTTYWTLAGGKMLMREATGEVAPKPVAQQRWIGRSVPRLDLPAKITGKAIFVQDLRPEGLLHGRVVRPPGRGARLLEADLAAAERMPGVVKVVRDGSFLGVVAEGEWQAIRAAEALRAACRWSEGTPVPADPWVWLLAQPAQDAAIRQQARTDAKAPARTLKAEYRRPFQMHGSIGPSCAIAELKDGELTVFTHSQTVFDTGPAIAKMLGMEPGKVRLRHAQGSGCYGHNGADDVAADAALLARAVPGRPVRVQWMRADEHGFEPLGPAMLTRVEAGLDADGNVLDWRYELWSTSHGVRPGGDPGNLLAGGELAAPFPMPTPRDAPGPNYAAGRNAIPGYAFPGQSVNVHFVTALPVRTSSHRSLGAFANVFSIESFMDEIAHAVGADPLNYRLDQLNDKRGWAVLMAAAERFGWSAWKKAPGRGRGIGYARYKGLATWCAICLEVEVDPAGGRARAVRAVLAADAGEVVSPDGLKNQLEGGLIQGLSWASKEQVRFEGDRVASRDWASYPILTFAEVPEVEVELIDRPGEPFLGAGEAAQGPAAAAFANAVFDATGVRVRDLPITWAKIAGSRPPPP
jgi:CO/xanthine dehydrogenase Mo-binding subunit